MKQRLRKELSSGGILPPSGEWKRVLTTYSSPAPEEVEVEEEQEEEEVEGVEEEEMEEDQMKEKRQ